MTVRISATDWHGGGIDADALVEIARAFAEHCAASIDVSTGQVVADERPAYGRSYQAPSAERIRNEVGRKYVCGGHRRRCDLVVRRRELDHLGRPGGSLRTGPSPSL